MDTENQIDSPTPGDVSLTLPQPASPGTSRSEREKPDTKPGLSRVERLPVAVDSATDPLLPEAIAGPSDKVNPAPRRCSSLTKAGSRCKGYALHSGETCLAHSPEGKQAQEKAVRASIEARQGAVVARKEAVEASKLTLTQWFARIAGENAQALATKAVERALDGDVRALTIVLERVEGKVADHLITEAGDPFTMTEAQIAKWLEQPALEHGTTPDPSDTNA